MPSTTTPRASASHIPDRLAAAFGFAVAVAFWPGLLSSAVAPRWSLIAVGLPFFLWRPAAANVSLLALGIGYAALSLLWAPDPLNGAFALSHLMLFALAAMIEERLAGKMLYGLAAGVAFTAPLAWAQKFGFSPIEQAVPVAGLFLNRNVFAEIAAPLLIYAVLKRRWWPAIGCFLIIVAAYDRAALLGLGAAAILLCRRWQARLVLGIAAFVLAALATRTSGWGVESASARLMLLGLASKGMTLFGNGIGAFGSLQPQWEYLHNDPVQLVYELGIGATPILAVVVGALRRRDRLAERAALACLVVESLFSMPLELPTSALVAGLLVGRLGPVRRGLRDRRHDGRNQLGTDARRRSEDSGDVDRRDASGGVVVPFRPAASAR